MTTSFHGAGSSTNIVTNNGSVSTRTIVGGEYDPDPKGIRFRVDKPEINFVGRLKELKDLESLTASGNTAAVSGTGGLGKTQLLRQFIEENGNNYENIICINSKSDESIRTSFEELSSDILHIPTDNANKDRKSLQSIVEQVLAKLRKYKTLFVYDDVGSVKSINFALKMATPLGLKPDIIITSRLNNWPAQVKVIELQAWNETESITFISKMLQSDESSDSESDKSLLASTLHFFPLALRQSTVYINEHRRNDDFEIAQYIEKFECNARKMLHSKIFQRIGYALSKYEKTTYNTWNITVDTIRNDKLNGQLAIRIFKTIAYLDAEDIERSLFFRLNDYAEGKQQTDFEKRVKSAVDLLIKYCMLTGRDKQRFLNVHPLVQKVTRLQLKETDIGEETGKVEESGKEESGEDEESSSDDESRKEEQSSEQEESAMRDALQLISKFISTQRYKIREHAITAFQFALTIPDLVVEFGSLAVTALHQSINSSLALREFDEATMFSNKILKRMTDILGENDRILLRIRYYIAKICLKSDNPRKALEMSLDIFKRQMKHFGPDDLDTLKTQSRTADSYEASGKNEEAFEWHKKVFAKRKIRLGEKHHHTIETKCKIGFFLQELGRTREASQVYHEVFEKEKNLFDPVPPGPLNSNLLVQTPELISMRWKIGDQDVTLRTHKAYLYTYVNCNLTFEPNPPN